jgi:tetratricopeptide (TPR) repeat protein
MVLQSYYLKGDFKTAGKMAADTVEGQIKSGGTPSEQLLLLGRSCAVKQDDEAGISRWTDRLVAYYPKPEYWQNVLDSLYRTKMPDHSLLQVYRLAYDVDALKEAGTYTDMAQLALDAGSPGEAVEVLQKGFDTNVFTQTADKNRNQHLLDTAKKQAAQDQPSLPKFEASAANAPDGNRYIGVGTGYFGYKQYDKAATDLAAGIAKGNLKDPVDAELLLGVAQLKAGKKDDAIASFKKVKGDPILERVASLWVIHARG